MARVSANQIDWEDTPTVSTRKKTSEIDWETPTPKPTTNEFENFAAGTMVGLMSPFRAAAKYATMALPESLKKYGYTEADVADQKRFDAPLLNTTGGSIGNVVGEGIITAVPTGALYNAGRGLYAGSRLIPKILTSATSGAASGAAGSLMTGNDDPEQLALAAGGGGVLAPVMHGASTLAGKAWDYGARKIGGHKNLVAEYLRNQLGNRTRGAVRALRNLESPIGENLTAGRAAIADGGLYPELMQLDQEVSLGRLGGRANQIEQNNRNIRAEILRRQAEPGVRPIGPDGRLQNSQIMQDIEETAKPLYQAASENPVILNPKLENAIEASLTDPSVINANKVVNQRDAIRMLRGESLSPIPQTGGVALPWGPRAQYPGASTSLPIDTIENLQQVKGAIQGNIDKITTDPYKARVMGDTRRALTERMRAASPDFADAEDHFAGLMRSQNQADYAAELLRTLEPIQGARQNYVSTIAKMNDPEAVLKSINAPSGIRTVEELFSNRPGRLNELRNLQEALEREVKYSQLPGNRGVIDKIESPLSGVEQATPSLLKREVIVAKNIARQLGGRQEEKMMNYLDTLVSNPRAMADVIESIPANQRNAVVNYLRDFAKERGNQVVGGTTGFLGQQIGENYAP